MDSTVTFVWALLSIAPFKDGGVFSFLSVIISNCGPRRCKAGILAQGQIRRSYPSLGRTPFCPRRCECASLDKGQEAPKLPPLGLFSVREISAIVIYGGRWPAIPAVASASDGIGLERPWAPALDSPGRPKPPHPFIVPRSEGRLLGGFGLSGDETRSGRIRRDRSRKGADPSEDCNPRQTRAAESGRYDRTRTGEAVGASPGLSGKAETADPFRSPSVDSEGWRKCRQKTRGSAEREQAASAADPRELQRTRRAHLPRRRPKADTEPAGRGGARFSIQRRMMAGDSGSRASV